jgi:hypothetical protein
MKIINQIRLSDNTILAVLVGLIVVPWLMGWLLACVDKSVQQSVSCAASFGPQVAILMVIGVLGVTAMLKKKGVTAWWAHLAIQSLGLFALLGLRNWPLISATLYIVSLIYVCTFHSRGKKIMVFFSPVYTVLSVLIFLSLLISSDTIADLFMSALPELSDVMILFWVFLFALFGTLFTNAWTKRHSIIIYALNAILLLILVFFLFTRYVFQNFKVL